ncbi:hypothetical protein [Nonomuraea ceibae]|uniref:hypothetical protein n=1 Tax=Nonomuraea ceibae TaxID=1935170 RepID=UPI001C5F8A6C|nr:hypothetical protein [Nonomuraea ceibae]
MTDQGTTITLELPRPPAEVFAAVLDVRGWWSRNVTGATAAEGDEFGYEVPGVHRCRIRLTEVVPGRRVVWRVLDSPTR